MKAGFTNLNMCETGVYKDGKQQFMAMALLWGASDWHCIWTTVAKHPCSGEKRYVLTILWPVFVTYGRCLDMVYPTSCVDFHNKRFLQEGGKFCTGNFSHEKISRRVYFAQWPEN